MTPIYRVRGAILTEREHSVPLGCPDGPQITVFTREVETTRPTSPPSGWMKRAIKDYRVLLLESARDGALALSGQLGMRPLFAHCHLGLGKLCRRTGDGARAREHLTTAATMYREMGMTFWVDKAEAVLGSRHGHSP